MSVLSVIRAAKTVGPWNVVLNNSVYYVGPWGISADGKFVGPYAITTTAVGPYPWLHDGAGNYWLGPYLVA